MRQDASHGTSEYPEVPLCNGVSIRVIGYRLGMNPHQICCHRTNLGTIETFFVVRVPLSDSALRKTVVQLLAVFVQRATYLGRRVSGQEIQEVLGRMPVDKI